MSKARDLADLGSVTTRLDEVGNTDGALSNRNKIINGAMVIDQRNAGAAVTLSTGAFAYPVDRFSFYRDTLAASTAQRSSVAPQGFANSALYSVTTGATASASHQNIVQYNAEGADVSSFGWGASGAQEITVSFWVRSSLVGTYGFSVSNSAFDRSYVAEYSVSVAGTWEYKTIAIPGDTSGTWLKDNGIGIRLRWDLGSGSNFYATPGSWSAAGDNTTSAQANLIGTTGATFQITGVQLEAGDTATPFEHRSYGQELALCQRYYQISGAGSGFAFNSTTSSVSIPFLTQMRASPSVILANGSNTLLDIALSLRNISSINSIQAQGSPAAGAKMDVTNVATTANKYHIVSAGAFAFSAEL